jgi:transcription initiation factor TFIID subunit 2
MSVYWNTLLSYWTLEWERINKTLAAADKAIPIAHSQPSPPREAQAVIEEDIDALILQEITETPPPPPPPPARQSIKLKVNGIAKGTGPPQTPQQSKPPKVLKPKPPTAPPPPPPPPPDDDDDDGAKDLLEEVLAMEEEQKQEKKSKGPRLAISLPKKERLSDNPHPQEISPVAGPSRSAPTPPASKVKKSANGHGPPSSKGKEKEINRPAPTPAKHRAGPSIEGQPINDKKCREILKKLIAMPQALLFRQPVDADLLGCPTSV